MMKAEHIERAEDRARLTPDDGIPLYLKLASIFRDQIRTGVWPLGHRIGPLPELQAQYGVARATVQQAIRQLSQQGLLSSERGRGTFVTGSIGAPGGDAPSYDRLSLDPRFSIEVLERRETDRCEGVRTPLPDEERPFMHVRKRHLLRGEPYSLVDLFLPASLYAQLPAEGDAARLYAQLLRDHTDIDRVEARSTCTIVAATQDVASLLDVPLGAPLVRWDSMLLSGEGRPLASYLALIRGDMFMLQTNTRDLLSIDPSEWRPIAPAAREDAEER